MVDERIGDAMSKLKLESYLPTIHLHSSFHFLL
jgi:hypothetical protein